MFRYIGFKWDPAAERQATIASNLEESIQRADGWQPALAKAGIRVYAIGARSRVNGIYPLTSSRGVILGRLFRRRGEPSGSRDVEITENESDRILRSGGRALVDDYWGRYTALLSPGWGETVLIRDPGGTLPCYQQDIDGVAVFFSWLEDLIGLLPHAPPPRVDWDATAAFLALHHLGGHETALQGISQALPGRATALGKSARSSAPLWSAVAFARRPCEQEPVSAAAALRQAVVDSTSAWSSCYDSILLRLSGGVDSAILLGSLSAQREVPRITCLNYHSPGSDSDERGFARLAAARAGVTLVERERDPGVSLHDVLEASRTPTPEPYIGRMGTGRIDAEVASRHRAQAMFTGAGGDQLFLQLSCTWPAADYLRLHGPGPGFLRASLDAARLGRVSLWSAMRQAVADRRRRTGPLDGAGQFATLASREALADVRGFERHVHPDLLDTADLPIGKFHHVEALINPLGYYDPYLLGAAPELVNPLLSQPLVELCLTLPTYLLTHGGRGRALARRAFAHDIPREIATRQSKGGMEAHVATILRHNLALARSLLLDGDLVRQGLLDRKKVEAALAGRLSASGGYLSEIHGYIAIEAWLRRFKDPSRSAAT